MKSELCDFHVINKIAMSESFKKQVLAPTVPRCVHANGLSFEIFILLVVMSSRSYQSCLGLLSSLYDNAVNIQLEVSQAGQIQVPVVHARTLVNGR